VYWQIKNMKWFAAITISGKLVNLGSYIGEDEAARRYDLAALHRHGRDAKINFQVPDYLDAAGELVPELVKDGATTLGGEPLTSKYNGVSWHLKGMKWQAHIGIGSKKEFLGLYIEEEEAAQRFDLAALHLRGRTAKINFKVSDYLDAAGELVDEPLQDGATTLGGEPLTSKFNGLCWHSRDMKWIANIIIGGKKVHLGYFPKVQEEAAARAFDRAAIHCRDLRPHCSSLEWLLEELNFPLSDYTSVQEPVSA
jgi:hypothetical protein